MPTNLSPTSATSSIILPSTGTYGDVASAVPFGVYTGSANFLSGAALQVAYTYKKLGGDIVDIEITAGNVYAAYEEAVLEYSYIINLHQGKNVLSDALGKVTGTFNYNGERIDGPSGASLKFPRIQISYTNRIGDSMATMAGFGGTVTIYSGSFVTVKNQEVYDLQTIISSSSVSGEDDRGAPIGYSGKVGASRVIIDKVFYRSPVAMWRFYGYYGGIGVVGNYSTYGQYADDSTFEIVPTWQNKLQAINYEDSVKTRISQYSYEIQNNKLVIYPAPDGNYPKKLWVKFTVQRDAWDEHGDRSKGHDGVNNMNTLPYANIPYDRINSIGKQWIRRFALALCKEMLGHIRSKFGGVPLPGGTVTLDGATMVTEGKTEQKELRDELKTVLDELTYAKLVERDANMTDNATKALTKVPIPIFIW